MQELVNGQRSKKYLKDGMEHTGGSRKMPDGSIQVQDTPKQAGL